MQLSRVLAILLRQYYLLRGSMARVFPLFAWGFINIVLWGFITRYLNQITATGGGLIPAFLGAVLLWEFLSRVMLGVTTAFFEDVWARNFLNIFATPLKISEYILGLVLSSIFTSTVGLVVMLALATAAFGLSLLVYGAMIIPFVLILFLFGISLGIFGAAMVMRFGPASEWFVWPIPAIISPFACVFYPLATLPHWMQSVSLALPPSYVFEGMRTIVAHGTVPVGDLLWGSALALAYIAAACWCFTRVYRYAVRVGLIARYSAESIS